MATMPSGLLQQPGALPQPGTLQQSGTLPQLVTIHPPFNGPQQSAEEIFRGHLLHTNAQGRKSLVKAQYLQLRL